MQNRIPTLCSRCGAKGFRGEGDFADCPPVPDFDPVPRKCERHDGWTPQRQRDFIAAIAETGSVKRAARSINMSPEGAYFLRRQPGAEGFRAAWEAALDYGVRRLVDVTMERAIDGVPVPVFWRGEQVGERRWYNDRLAMFHLRHRLPEKYGAFKPFGGVDAKAEEQSRPPDVVCDEFRRSVERIHARWQEVIARDPARVAAYRLIFDREDQESLHVRIAHLPMSLRNALLGPLEGQEEDKGEEAEPASPPRP